MCYFYVILRPTSTKSQSTFFPQLIDMQEAANTYESTINTVMETMSCIRHTLNASSDSFNLVCLLNLGQLPTLAYIKATDFLWAHQF